MMAFFIGALSIIGLPPLGGFISKWNLVLGSLEAGQIPILVVLLTSSLLNAAYFLPIVYQGFFGKANPGGNPGGDASGGSIHEAPFLAVAAPVITALCSIALFFYPGVFLDLAAMVVGK
jgi:multicomponent Na+:H+ antiporter subunit D